MIAVDNPEKLLKKKNIAEGFKNHNPLHRSFSLPEELIDIQDLDFDLFFEQSLFRTKSDNFLSDTVLDQDILRPRILERPLPKIRDCPQQSVEFHTLTVTTASVSIIPTSSTSLVTSPLITQVVVQTPPPAMATRYAPLVLVAPLHDMP